MTGGGLTLVLGLIGSIERVVTALLMRVGMAMGAGHPAWVYVLFVDDRGL
jgi:hypothetical protein